MQKVKEYKCKARCDVATRAVYEELRVLNSNISEDIIKKKMRILRRQSKKSQ